MISPIRSLDSKANPAEAIADLRAFGYFIVGGSESPSFNNYDLGLSLTAFSISCIATVFRAVEIE